LTFEDGAVRSQLAALGVPRMLADQLCGYLDDTLLGVLIYGSWARQDAGPQSDLDILTLSETCVDDKKVDIPAKLSLSRYTPEQLQKAGRTLFGMHLARDGIIIYDRNNRLRNILGSFSSPDPGELLSRLLQFSAIFDIPRDQLIAYLPGLCKLARYLLRSAIYAVALSQGAPCFSVKELAERFSDPALVKILSSHPGVHPEASIGVLDDLRERLANVVGGTASNRFGSIHSLIVGYWDSDPDIAYLATLALGSRDSLPYSEVPKVIL
jgi:hypothetical protein